MIIMVMMDVIIFNDQVMIVMFFYDLFIIAVLFLTQSSSLPKLLTALQVYIVYNASETADY